MIFSMERAIKKCMNKEKGIEKMVKFKNFIYFFLVVYNIRILGLASIMYWI